MAKIYLPHAYKSVSVDLSSYESLGLKNRFSGDTGYTYHSWLRESYPVLS